MKNTHLDQYTSADIDAQVLKVLRDLGNPEPPLNLEHVRELLRLAKGYYSAADDGFFKRWIHSLKVAGKQIAERPGFLKDFIQNFRLDALCLFDEKRILISEQLPTPKQRWAEGHEIGHVIIPWHGPISLGDDKYTLMADCHEMMESEANYAARRLLFLRDKFRIRALASEPTLAHVGSLKDLFGNTMTTTFYSLVERLDVPAFGLITGHPKRPDKDFDPTKPCQHFITSLPFDAQFANVTDLQLYSILESYCGYGRWDLGKAEKVISNSRKETYVFRMETVFNHYDALTLGVMVRKHEPTVSILTSF
ncbi:MAG TPA: ImmA/IrrE family metallo-endopeptidase [Candidatus Sulfotelmatobacter sp.]|nr:ImmA/IrrE family metallo-endopeptidase [Candidatus Sulfotelmatobacter sp.]